MSDPCFGLGVSPGLRSQHRISYRKGYGLCHIAALTGHKTLTAVRRLVDSDPVKLGELVSGIV